MFKQDKTILRILAIVAGVLLIGIVALFFVFRSFLASGVTAGPDQMFGDQHLKTVVALVELHKVRNGSYPDSLRDLKFVGAWDQNAILSVRYIVSSDRQHYYVEVERGWVGKPTLELPAEFWQGTGYDPTLRPATP